MRPYLTLAKLGRVNGIFATLKKKNGDLFSFYVKPENFGSENLEGAYANAIGVRVWSANVADLADSETGATRFPESGDVLIVTLDDETTKSFSITRSVATARFWDWFYTRPGYRLKFYTKYEGFDSEPSTNNEGAQEP